VPEVSLRPQKIFNSKFLLSLLSFVSCFKPLNEQKKNIAFIAKQTLKYFVAYQPNNNCHMVLEFDDGDTVDHISKHGNKAKMRMIKNRF